MKATTRTEGILPALETAHAVAALPKLLAGVGGRRRLVAGRGARPARLLRARRQGPRGARAFRRGRAVGRAPGDRGRGPGVAACRSPRRTRRRPGATPSTPGHPTFRVKDKIFLITGRRRLAAARHPDRRRRSRPTLLAVVPGRGRQYAAVHRAASAGSTCDFAGIPDEVLRETIEGAWARTAPEDSSPPTGGPPR